ncbi:response regulator [Colwellia sp. MB3u-55]|uniref:response regulator n=1 Tax=Colwellia sp. MB3u-55 TaxID=2759810 RepID=UPI0015F66C65|nr:response regulator [Colwellia sp. MB3u-55]MBA6250768.1 response regulator [Colwellia sp. MB3u-55]
MPDRKLNILVADDEPLMLSLLSEYLTTYGNHNVIQACNGKKALQLFNTNKSNIDVTFLDIEMPYINGLKVLQAIHSIEPSAYVVIISGLGNLHNVKTAISAGVNGFIVKPYTYEKVAEALNNYLHAYCTE